MNCIEPEPEAEVDGATVADGAVEFIVPELVPELVCAMAVPARRAVAMTLAAILVFIMMVLPNH
jgi:hypothetical protein